MGLFLSIIILLHDFGKSLFLIFFTRRNKNRLQPNVPFFKCLKKEKKSATDVKVVSGEYKITVFSAYGLRMERRSRSNVALPVYYLFIMAVRI